MKFLIKINRNYLFLFSTILLVLSISGYFVLKTIILQNTKENLLAQETLIVKQISGTGIIPNLKPLIEITTTSAQSFNHPEFREVSIFNNVENEAELFVEYTNVVKINEKFYTINLREASVESEDLAFSIAAFIFVLLTAAFSVSYFITKRLNKTIWNIFEHNLRVIEDFDIRENKILQLRISGIDEFDRLNAVVYKLTGKLKKEFIALKEFTENASHEFQTPLAIASLNLEEILQQELNEESFRKVVTAIQALKRLSLLNQNLLLLTKIENDQFTSGEFIVINEIILRKVQEFEPLLNEKGIKIDVQNQSDFLVQMKIQLVEILINNLISNAVNHNIVNGFIAILIEKDEFKICNSGSQNQLNNETIFQRFIKGNSKSPGLGLAIVKQICNSHQLEIKYSKSDVHCFTISHNNTN
jgi:signal transduction histidine kinase